MHKRILLAVALVATLATTVAIGQEWGKAVIRGSIQYIAWDGSRWAAKVDGPNFFIAPNGDWARGHTSVQFDYFTKDGEKWSAKRNGPNFLLAPNGNWQAAHSSRYILFFSWDRARYYARFQPDGTFLVVVE